MTIGHRYSPKCAAAGRAAADEIQEFYGADTTTYTDQANRLHLTVDLQAPAPSDILLIVQIMIRASH